MRELNGTAFHTFAPVFLQMPESSIQARRRERDIPDENDFGPAAEGGMLRGDVGDILLSVDEDTNTRSADEAIVLDMGGLDEVSAEEEFSLENTDQHKEEISMPAIDFGDMDISDLAPPAVERTESTVREKKLVRVDEGLIVEPAVSASSNGGEVAGPNSSPLEDLQFNDLHLDTPSQSVSNGSAGKRMVPSIKTGTALDAFEVDLGELFAEPKK